MSARFLQLHTLTSYPASLLNRDDAGFAKRMPFGGAVRTRISSQCLKRHWRVFEGDHSLLKLGEEPSVRSRITFEEKLVKPLIDAKVDPEVARPVVLELMKLVLGQSPKAAKKDEGDSKKDAAAEARTDQVTVLGPKELAFLLQVARDVCAAVKPGKDLAKSAEKALKEKLGSEGKKNLAALGRASKGLDAALFGRMVTGDVLARGDAAIHVAHALTVHGEQSEADYFSAVDELLRASSKEGGQGSGHISNAELTSGIYYGYVVIDVPLLVANLEGCEARDWEKADKGLARKVVASIIQLASTVTPGAKLGSTAPHSQSSMVLVESGSAQPRTLANAFLQPVRLQSDRNPLHDAYEALGRFIADSDEMYPSAAGQRRLAALGDASMILKAIGQEKKVSVDAAAAWDAEAV